MAWLDDPGHGSAEPFRDPAIFSYYTLIVRFILPVLAAIIVCRVARSLLTDDYDRESGAFSACPTVPESA